MSDGRSKSENRVCETEDAGKGRKRDGTRKINKLKKPLKLKIVKTTFGIISIIESKNKSFANSL